MNRYKLIWMTGLISGCLSLPQLAHADRRNFVWNYEAKTVDKEEAEIEYYITGSADRPDSQADDDFKLVHQVEIEYGVTDHFDIAMYQVFEDNEADGFFYGGYKARGRYRFSDAGEYFVDPLVYLEVHHNPTEEELEFEEKIVLVKTIGNCITTFNLTAEQESKYKNDVEKYEIKPSLGVGYQFAPWITLGLEAEDRIIHEQTNDHNAFLLGPTIALAGQKLWWNVGALIQATDDFSNEPRYEVRSIMGIYF